MFFEKAKKGNNQWYLYVLTILIVFVGVEIANIPIAIYALWTGLDIYKAIGTNMGLALTLFAFGVGLFVLFFCIRYFHKKKVLDITTGRSSFDWRRFCDAAFIWGSLTAIGTVISGFGDGNIEFQFEAWKFFPLLLIGLILLPLQTSFEEYIFRGYLMQGFSLLFRNKWIACIITSLIFGAMHLANTEVAQFGYDVTIPQYVIMGLLLGVLTVWDDGMEFALGIHFINNFFGCVIVSTDYSSLQTNSLWVVKNTTITHADTLIILLCSILTIVILHIKYRFIHKNA